MYFAQPGWLWLLVLMPLPLLLERARPRIAWPDLDGFPRRHPIGSIGFRPCPPYCEGSRSAALLWHWRRPQTVGGVTWIAGQGVAIVVALDQSSSMNALDFPADRGTRFIWRAGCRRSTFIQFVEGRPDDLIGLVLFANFPQLNCAPVVDHAALIERVAAVQPARARGRWNQHRRCDRGRSGSPLDRPPQAEGSGTLDRWPQRPGRASPSNPKPGLFSLETSA